MAESSKKENGVSSSEPDKSEEEEKEPKSKGEKTEESPDTSYRANLPKAIFVEDVDKFMQEPGNSSAEQVLRRFDELHTKYKFMESNLIEKKRRLRNRLPDIQKTLNMIKYLKSIQGTNKSFTTHYQLSGGVHGTAEVPPTEIVYLWLGANVMLEYPIDEAMELLTNNLDNALKSLTGVEEDLEYITEQCTTLEVAMTRVYNWDVKERREKKLASLQQQLQQ